MLPPFLYYIAPAIHKTDTFCRKGGVNKKIPTTAVRLRGFYL